MSFNCLKEKLEYAVSLSEKFTGKNTTLPVLEHILLETRPNTLFITSTNLEHAIHISINGNGEVGEKSIIPAKIFSYLLQSVKDSKIEIECRKNILYIKTPSLNAKINGYPSDEFPIIPKVIPKATFYVDTLLLAQGLEKVLPAISLSEFKPELNGIYFKITPSALYLVATDTFRLAEKIIPLAAKSEDKNYSFILPQKISQELRRVLFKTEEENTKILLGDNQILFMVNGIEVTSRLVEGNFPEYQNIIPKSFDTNCFIKKDEITQAVRASSVFSSRLNNVLLEFKPECLSISSINPELGEHNTKITTSLTGKNASVQFNHRFLLDGINALEEEELLLGVNNESTPAIIRNKSDGSFLYLIMPLKIT